MDIKAMQEQIIQTFNTKGNGKYVWSCIDDDTLCDGKQRDIFFKLWEEAENFAEFLKRVRECADLKYTSQGYAEIGKLERWEIPIRKEVDPKWYISFAATLAISVCVQEEKTSAKIFSQTKNGTHIICIIDGCEDTNRNFNHYMMDLVAEIEGSSYIYEFGSNGKQDGKSLPIPEGCYRVFMKDEIIVLERIIERTYIKVGSYIPETDDHEAIIERAYYRQGYIFKDEDAFLNHPDQVCYVPELDDAAYTREAFMSMCNGQEEFARECFYAVDWQHPETWIDEQYRDNEWGWCEHCQLIYNMDGEPCPCPKCGRKSE